MLFLSFYASILVVIFTIIFFVLINLRPMIQSYYTSHTVPVIYQIPNSDITALPSQIEYWQLQLQKQPTSRDILLNLSLLYQQNNQLDLAKEYKTKAEAVDPNYTSRPDSSH
ncbi:hypothetical protein BH10PAT2_BH10PAT2_4190 [soil metagenome]